MKKLKITKEQYDRLIVENNFSPSTDDLLIVDINNEYFLINKNNKQIESFIGDKTNIKDKNTLCSIALNNYESLFETKQASFGNIYKDNGNVIGSLSSCKKGSIQEVSKGKKIKLTEQQWSKLLESGVINEKVKVIRKSINESFDIKNEVKELIKYLYRKSDEFSPFWVEQGLTYDDIIEILLAKKLIVSKNGKYELSKNISNPQDAIQAVESELTKLIKHKTNDVGIAEETNAPAGAEEDQDAPFNKKDLDTTKPRISKDPKLSVVAMNNEVAILKSVGGSLYAFYYYDINKDDFSEYASIVRHYIGKDEDGIPEYDYDKNDFEIDEYVINNYVNDNISSITKGVGIDSYENNTQLVKIDDELKEYLTNLYDKDKNIFNVLNQITEVEFSDVWSDMKAKLAKSQTPPTERIPQSNIEAKLGELKAKEMARRDAENAAFKKMRSTGDEIDETTTAGSSATGGSSGPYVGPMGGPIKKSISDKIPVVAEMNTTGGVGQYDTPGGLTMDLGKSNPKSKAEKTPQWAGGSFVKQPECSKMNNNKEAQNGGCNQGASSLKTVKASGSVNAPSLAENKIYVEIANKTGKTIEEIKLIIESKNN
jgi:hypothetical protein